MKKTKNFFSRRKNKDIYQKYLLEESVFINPKINKLKNAKNIKRRIKAKINIINNYIKINFWKLCYLIIIILIILFSILIFLYFSKSNNSKKTYKTKIDEKYRNILPKILLSNEDKNNTNKPSNAKYLEEIFYSRQIYINNARITQDYLRYIRPINEADKKNYPKKEIKIDDSIFNKRNDQYNYLDFSKINLEERLINETEIQYNNEPLISVVIPSYNKEKDLLKSVRSIQNQKLKNIEIIIVNDNSNDNSSKIFDYLLNTDSRVRIFHHMTNLGCWRSRMDGILYSKGKYVILFDAGDLYEDNYVLEDALNVIETYNLDSCKFLFRVIRRFNKIQNSHVFFHIGKNPKITYEHLNIKAINDRVFITWGNVWNRLVRANIFTKALLLCNELMLNVHKNMWDDSWFNRIVNRASDNFVIFERVGYVYLQDGNGEGSNLERNDYEKAKKVKEYVGFLYYDYNFAPKDDNKDSIINVLKKYNTTDPKLKLQNFKFHFEVLNDLLEALIADPAVTLDNKKFLEQLLKESKEREIEVKKNDTKNSLRLI